MLQKIVNLREGKKGDFLVSFPYYNDGGVRVERFCLREDSRFEGRYEILRKHDGMVFRETTINLQEMRDKYPDMNDDGVKRLFLYLTARKSALNETESSYGGVFIDRTRGLKDLVHVDEHAKKLGEDKKFWNKRLNPFPIRFVNLVTRPGR